MKKIVKPLLILFVFCLTFALGEFFVPNKTFAEGEATVKTISSATELKEYVEGYGNANQTDNIVLSADIDMADITLNKTIGNEEIAFMGTFDGRGYSISNLTVDVTNDMTQEGAVLENNQYAGLFGSVDGATIRNVALKGEYNLRTGGTIKSYIGALVGKATASTIECVQSTADVVCNSIYDSYVEFGALIGSASNNTQVKNVICRSADGFSLWTFNNKQDKISYFGGMVGVLTNSKIIFSVVEAKYNFTVGEGFIGDISVGGVAGKIEGSNSRLVNIAMQNNFVYLNNALTSIDAVLNVGEIAGEISNPAPISANISNIKYKHNGDIERFGSIGSYTYTDSDNFDMILPTTEKLDDLKLTSGLVPDYFANAGDWHWKEGNWDFEQVWYNDAGTIYLQSFSGKGEFSLEVSRRLLEKGVLTTANEETKLRYGDEAIISFGFAEGMEKYFELSSIKLTNNNQQTKEATIYTVPSLDPEGEVTYEISGFDMWEIRTTSTGFDLIIKQVNRSTSGTYDIATVEKVFTGTMTSRLYSDTDQLVANTIPGYVYTTPNTITNTETDDFEMTYQKKTSIETQIKKDTPNAFVGWYIVGDGEDTLITTSRNYTIVFGEGLFVGDFEIYAKYVDKACEVTFRFDAGIKK
ncbi:MAG: hypothetical protein E7375_01450 [Clostridiales bacterium]|nr:hypothetical protein [Clostridiales bacterium]